VKSTRFTERLNFEKELKSTVWGREFQQLITRSLKKLARVPSLPSHQWCFSFMNSFGQLGYIISFYASAGYTAAGESCFLLVPLTIALFRSLSPCAGVCPGVYPVPSNFLCFARILNAFRWNLRELHHYHQQIKWMHFGRNCNVTATRKQDTKENSNRRQPLLLRCPTDMHRL